MSSADYERMEGGGMGRRRDNSGCLKGALAVAIVAILGLAVAVGYYAHKAGENDDKHGNTPASAMPAAVEADIRRWMDASADPCTDPYKYMCGGFMNDVTLDPDRGIESITYGFFNISMRTTKEQFGILADHFPFIGPFFDGCRDTAALDAAGMSVLDTYFGMIDGAGDSLDDVLRVAGKLQVSGVASTAGPSWDVQADLSDATPYRLYISPGGLTIPGVDLSGIKTDFTGLVSTYLAGAGHEWSDPANATAAAEVVYDLENAIFQQAWSQIEAYSTPDYFRFAIGNSTTGTLAQLSAPSVTGLPLASLVEGITSFVTPEDPTVDIDSAVVIGAPALQNLGKLLSATPISSIKTYLKWHVVWSSMPWLADPLRTAAANLQAQGVTSPDWSITRDDHVIVSAARWGKVNDPPSNAEEASAAIRAALAAGGAAGRTPPGFDALGDDDNFDPYRAYLCMQSTVTHFTSLFSHEWVAANFPAGNKAVGQALVEDIRGAMQDTINDAAWLADTTRAAALDKLSKIAANVAYPSSWTGHIGLRMTGGFFADRATSLRWGFARSLATVGHPVDRHGFTRSMDLMTQNAFYQPTTNSINMLAGLMLDPMFSADWPQMLNTASYGYVIGHEITHGFDNNGRWFDGVGAFRDWWEEADSAEFDRRAQCLINQYSSFTYWGLPVSGANTLGENIADEGGVENSWRAYQKIKPDAPLMEGFTNDQLFFLKLGQTWCTKDTKDAATQQLKDVHSPGKFRIIGPLSNFEPYADAFSCSAADLPGGRSKTPDACKVW